MVASVHEVWDETHGSPMDWKVLQDEGLELSSFSRDTDLDQTRSSRTSCHGLLSQ